MSSFVGMQDLTPDASRHQYDPAEGNLRQSGGKPDKDYRSSSLSLSEMLNAKDISSAIASRIPLLRPTQNKWDVIEDVVQEMIAPSVTAGGADAVLAVLVQGKDDPLVAAVLVDVSGESDLPFPRAGRAFFTIDEFFTDEEIIAGALEYLGKFPRGGLSDGAWAWTALWNGWHQLDGSAHERLVRELIEQAPDSDEILWMIADGPVSELIELHGGREELEVLARSDRKVARVLELVDEPR